MAEQFFTFLHCKVTHYALLPLAKTPINIQIAYPIQKVPLENVRALSQQMIWSLNKLPLAKKSKIWQNSYFFRKNVKLSPLILSPNGSKLSERDFLFKPYLLSVLKIVLLAH